MNRVDIWMSMNRIEFLYSLLTLFAVFISSMSQVLLKMAALKDYDSAIQEYLNPFVIVAYLMFAGSTLLAIFAYKYVPLSMGPILESTGYIYVTIFGVRLFGESINRRKIIALGMMVAGILIFAIWGQRDL